MTQPRLTLKQVQSLVERMPFNKSLGIRVKRLHTDGVTIECPLRDDLRNGAGVLHGGVTATLADAAVGIALAHHFGGMRRVTTIELKVNYFLPVSEGKVIARARLLRIGRTLCVGRVDLLDVRRQLVGAALVTYMLL